ncbi:ArsR/SmtB family transcription factor [Parenemella sanctibonifatiensis]|uniref:Transcriptional regulator n=1 Tax=Parenemella sanctibonifatiensis TaxID=2016505 RepID=A0A255DYZ2_9ACTN|nr:metalloregulator ArsR/SmtB family transcription factor [Parenemella sanctibonifatiensis]OYN84559.1 transcriptional regulator [Parenemella sanctibonifatiensis]
MTELPEAPMADAEACAPGGATISMEQAEQVALVVKALADPVRLRILHHIAASRCSSVCACHMPEVFGVTQPTLSHHLKKLVEAGLVDKEMRGRWAHFTPRPEGLAALTTLLEELS